MQGMQEKNSARNFENPLSKHPCPILKLENQQLRFGKEAQEEGMGLWAQEEENLSKMIRMLNLHRA